MKANTDFFVLHIVIVVLRLAQVWMNWRGYFQLKNEA